MLIRIRQAVCEDSDLCGSICYHGFKAVSQQHGFPSNFQSIASATDRIRAFIDHPSIYGIVAEVNGAVVGFSFISEYDSIRAVGPIVIDAAAQGQGVGRRLMAATLERAHGARGVRLVQEAFNMQSLALYGAVGFAVKEFLVLMTGTPRSEPLPGYEVRRMQSADIAECELLHVRAHGFARTNELKDRLMTGSPLVALRSGQVRAYVALPTAWLGSHGVAESDHDMQALLLGAAQIEKAPLSFLLPTRFANFFGWCLAEGFRAVKPMTLMSMGEYNDLQRIYFTSVSY